MHDFLNYAEDGSLAFKIGFTMIHRVVKFFPPKSGPA